MPHCFWQNALLTAQCCFATKADSRLVPLQIHSWKFAFYTGDSGPTIVQCHAMVIHSSVEVQRSAGALVYGYHARVAFELGSYCDSLLSLFELQRPNWWVCYTASQIQPSLCTETKKQPNTSTDPNHWLTVHCHNSTTRRKLRRLALWLMAQCARDIPDSQSLIRC